MNRYKLHSHAYIWLACCCLVFSGVDSEAAEIVAKVGDAKITLEDLRRSEQRLRRYGPEQNRRELLQPFIDREILRMEAERQGLDSAPRVQRTLETIRRRQLAEKVYTEQVTRKVTVSAEEILQYYQDYALDQKKEVRASHILLSEPEAVEKAVMRIAAGEDFAILAEELSEDSGTSQKGGDTGFWQEEDAHRSAFVKHFIGLDVGEIAKPYRNGRGGFHLVKVTEHRLLGLERQEDKIRRIVERKKKKERWKAYLAEERERYRLTVDEDALQLVLEAGRFALERMPPIDVEDRSRAFVYYEGGVVDVGAYLEMLRSSNFDKRPRPIDSTAVANFAIRESLRLKVLPLVAMGQGWHLDEGITGYLEEKKTQAMVEMLRRVKIEEPILTEEVRLDYYNNHQPDFLDVDRVFFVGGIVGSADEAANIIERLRQGEEMSVVMREYPSYSDQWRNYDAFHYSPSSEASLGTRLDKAIAVVRDLKPGEVGGPIKLDLGEGTAVQLVVQMLTSTPSRVFSFDDPQVQAVIWGKTRHEYRTEIHASFYSYLEHLRREYDKVVVVYDDVLKTFGAGLD